MIAAAVIGLLGAAALVWFLHLVATALTDGRKIKARFNLMTMRGIANEPV